MRLENLHLNVKLCSHYFRSWGEEVRVAAGLAFVKQMTNSDIPMSRQCGLALMAVHTAWARKKRVFILIFSLVWKGIPNLDGQYKMKYRRLPGEKRLRGAQDVQLLWNHGGRRCVHGKTLLEKRPWESRATENPATGISRFLLSIPMSLLAWTAGADLATTTV